ncbi:sulfate/molybdate ABC transporter ATP-binding protein [Brachybacterium saurashtrense]|uniref:ABC transporter ATP-binding protein n=1 Tax=Brachybacterium saurashtrense TaxID=556288 RepID=A0A345YMY7_9MICO|nr:ABC transporter ATP-binding protein [Brachybacterium saurashtrense]AXK45289.1 ABC transporter ATP-binding protein [Brachybacterium saurashtrense]RRR21955.1 ABC transporter ATP-binding protein [Brachybacterium saurashtrense]
MTLHLHADVPSRGVDLRLQVPDGGTLALVGPNGAGKSTVLSLVAGTLRDGHSRVELAGQLLTGPGAWVPPHARRVTTLSQDPVLFPHLTARANIAFALRARGVSRARARGEAARWLDELELSALADRRPRQLSGGQAQRVAIARALAAAPQLLLLDEPMAALDIDVAAALREQLRHYLAGRTAVIVTHDVLDALTLADSLAVLEGGRIVEQGAAAELLTRPRSAFTARFAGLNLLTGRWDAGAVVLEDGSRLPAAGAHPADASVHAAFRPAAVRPVADGGLRRTVRSLLPHGDLVRVRTEDLAADLSGQQVAAHALRPGAPVRLAVPREDVATYRA